jgi:hypothetical protein
MSSLKADSYKLTDQYVRMLGIEAQLKELGGDAPVADINRINRIRADVNMADECIKRQLRSKFIRDKAPDPDADCP